MAQTEQLGDDKSPAATAYRDRIRGQFTERYDEHCHPGRTRRPHRRPGPAANDPALLDELPYAPGLLAEAPAAIREALYAAFGIQCPYRQDASQVTIWATTTNSTPASSKP